MSDIKQIVIFASGSGSNAENIANFFKERPEVEIAHVFTNNKSAYVIERAKKLNIDYTIFSKSDFYESDVVLKKLENLKCDLIVLAGFLWLIPAKMVAKYPNRIINIHPALLPKFGGKGMYGDNVHKAVVENREAQSGITIHYVNEQYDKGDIIFQATCDVTPEDTFETVAQKVHQLEYNHCPKIVLDVVEML